MSTYDLLRLALLLALTALGVALYWLQRHNRHPVATDCLFALWVLLVLLGLVLL